MSEQLQRAKNVFVLGAPRSGTTIISAALRAIGYAGAHEGHILHVLHRMATAIEWHYENERNWLGKHNWTIDQVQKDWLIVASCRPLVEKYTELVGSEEWVDKTPGAEALAAIATFRKVLPDARYINCHRRGIEHVHSYLRRFGDSPEMFEEACATWASTMLERSLLPEEISASILDLSHAELVQNPAKVSASIADYLGCDTTTVGKLTQYFQNENPEKTGNDFSWKPLAKLTWPAAQKRRFLEICGPAMLLAGYWFNSPDELNESQGAPLKLAKIEDAKTSAANPDFIRIVADRKFLFHPGLPGETRTEAIFEVPADAPYNLFWVSCKIEHLQSSPLTLSVTLVDPISNTTILADEIFLTPMRATFRSWVMPRAIDGAVLRIAAKVTDSKEQNLFAWLTISQLGFGKVPDLTASGS